AVRAAPRVAPAPPFRLPLARGRGRDSLTLSAHHAAFDGRSCLRLLRLIADEYRAGRAGRAPAASRLPDAAPGRLQPPWARSFWPRLRIRRAGPGAPPATRGPPGPRAPPRRPPPPPPARAP